MNLTHCSLVLAASLGLFTSACVTQDPEVGSVEQSIKGKNKMFATQRSLNQVSVFDRHGNLEGVMTGAGLSIPFGAHVEGDDFYVVSQGNNAVYAHLHDRHENRDGTAWTLTELVPGATSGLSLPFYPNVRDGVLYVSSQNSNTFGEILRYDARTGAPLGAFAAPGAGGLDGPRGLDWDSEGNLYVAGFRSNTVVKFDANTGATSVLATVAAPCGVTINRDDEICVGSAGGTGVHCFEPDGTRIYGDSATTGQVVCGLDWGLDGRVYATRPPLNLVEAHDIDTGVVTPFATVDLVASVSWGTKSCN